MWCFQKLMVTTLQKQREAGRICTWAQVSWVETSVWDLPDFESIALCYMTQGPCTWNEVVLIHPWVFSDHWGKPRCWVSEFQSIQLILSSVEEGVSEGQKKLTCDGKVEQEPQQVCEAAVQHRANPPSSILHGEPFCLSTKGPVFYRHKGLVFHF